MIPNIIHFIYIKGPSFDFNIIHYMAVKSALLVQKPDKIYMYYSEEPNNNNLLWEETKKYVTLEKIIPPDEIYGIKIIHNAHKADIIRLRKLHERGGIYLDLDVISIKSLGPLLNNKCVMCHEKHKHNNRLGSSIILATKNNIFIKRWLKKYSTFEPNRQKYYSMKLPWIMSKKHPSTITTLDWPNFSPIEHNNYLLFGEKDNLAIINKVSSAYVIHMKSSWKKFYNKLEDFNYIREINTPFNTLFRHLLPEDPYKSNKLNDLFDAFIYINLDHRKDRYDHITKELEKHKFNPSKIHRISATYIKTNGAKGCSHSHYKAMDYAIKNNFNNVMIMEDDFLFTENMDKCHNLINDTINYDENWDVIMPYFIINKMNKRTIKIKNNIFKVTGGLGAYTTLCYCVNKKMMNTLRDNFLTSFNKQNNNPENNDSNYFVDKYWFPLQKRNNWYIIYPCIGTQLPGYSDIAMKNIDARKTTTR